MPKFMNVVKVAGKNYLVAVEANSASGAEHAILDMSECGVNGEYGVDACMAYDVEAMKADCFRWSAMTCETVSLAELTEIIKARNIEVAAHRNAVNAEYCADRIIESVEAAGCMARIAGDEYRIIPMNGAYAIFKNDEFYTVYADIGQVREKVIDIVYGHMVDIFTLCKCIDE